MRISEDCEVITRKSVSGGARDTRAGDFLSSRIAESAPFESEPRNVIMTFRVFSLSLFPVDEEGPYKPVPPPKPVPNNQKNQDGQQEHEQQAVAERSSRTTSGPERGSVAENGQVRGAGQPFAPEYRMPPLYGEEQSSSQAQQAASLQTHSSKFPVSATIMYADREITELLLY